MSEPDPEPDPQPPPLATLATPSALGAARVALVRPVIRREYFPTFQAYLSEQECIARAAQVSITLEAAGVKTKTVCASPAGMQTLRQFQPDLCLNFTDTLRGSSVLAASVPGMFEVLDMPYLGSSSFALSLGTQKHLVQSLLQSYAIPVPSFQLWHDDREVLDLALHFPLIAKLNEEHGSVGLTEQSVVTSERQLRRVVRALTTTYHQPVIVEQYIQGRELTAVVLQNSQLQVYLAERVYQTTKAQPKLLSFDKKWAIEMDQPDPLSFRSVTDLPPSVEAAIVSSVEQAFTVLKMADYGRFDIMVDAHHQYYFIDSNANPSLGPHSSVVRALATYGYDMADVLLFLLSHAARKKINPVVKKEIRCS